MLLSLGLGFNRDSPLIYFATPKWLGRTGWDSIVIPL